MKTTYITPGGRAVTIRATAPAGLKRTYRKADAISFGRAWSLIREYTEKCNVIFHKVRGVYLFEFPDADAEKFQTLTAAARFAAYNLSCME